MNRYFYIDAQGQQKGTYTPEELRLENIKRETLVWTQGMEQWERADEVTELVFLFSSTVSYTNPVNTEIQQPYIHTQQPQAQMPPRPKSWLIESVLVTILPFVFCCNVLSLLGIIGIVKASQVDSDYNRGNYEVALQSSKEARKWTMIVLWISIAVFLLYVVLAIVGVFSLGSLNELREMYEF